MIKLSVSNVGTVPVIIQDSTGYTPAGQDSFVMEIAPNATVVKNITNEQLDRIAPQLTAFEGEAADSLIKIRWSILSDSAIDDRTMPAELAGLPLLTEFRGSSYNVPGGLTDAVAVGTALLGNQTKASKQFLVGTARLDLEAVTPGGTGNGISFEYVTPASTLAVTVTGSKISVRPASGGSTVSAIASAINAHATAKTMVQASEGVAGTVNAVLAEAYLTGGKGPGVSLYLGGTACVITELTTTQITFNAPSGISAVDRIILLTYRNGSHITQLTVPVLMTPLETVPTLTELRAANYSTGSGATDVVAVGTDLIGNQVKATKQVLVDTARLDLEAVTPGAGGNDISFEFVTPASTLAVTVTTNKISVRPAVGGSTVSAIASAINSDADAKKLVQASEGVGGTVNATYAEAHLTGGDGPGVSLKLGGTACSITALTTTQITFDAAAGTSANGRIVPLIYKNGSYTTQISVPVVT